MNITMFTCIKLYENKYLFLFLEKIKMLEMKDNKSIKKININSVIEKNVLEGELHSNWVSVVLYY